MVLNQKVIESKIERAQKRLIAIGFMISRSAKQFCPVDTGRLRASISVNWTGSGIIRGNTESFSRGTSNPYGKQMESADSAADGIGQPPSARLGFFKVVVGTNVRYAPFIEFGTSKMGNVPFLRAGFEENKTFVERVSTMSTETTETEI